MYKSLKQSLLKKQTLDIGVTIAAIHAFILQDISFTQSITKLNCLINLIELKQRILNVDPKTIDGITVHYKRLRNSSFAEIKMRRRKFQLL